MLHWILTICVGIFDEQPLDGKEQTMSNFIHFVLAYIGASSIVVIIFKVRSAWLTQRKE